MTYTIFKEVSSKKMNSISDYNERIVLRNSSGRAVAEIRRVRRTHYYTVLTLCNRGEVYRMIRSYFNLDQKESVTPSDGQDMNVAA